jgi:hypothetical protein
MSPHFSLALAILFSVSGAAQEYGRATPAARQATAAAIGADVRGVWKVTEVASRAPGALWESRTTPYVSQFIFTAGHYSYMYVPGSGPRKRFSGEADQPTDAEKIEAYNSLVAATGTYGLAGPELTMQALVHKNPNEMVGTALRYTIAVDGDTMRMAIVSPPFLPGRELRMVLTRVE